MPAETTLWKFASNESLTQCYGHVHLLPQHVLGQWFCVARDSGKLLWQREFGRLPIVQEAAPAATTTPTPSPSGGRRRRGRYDLAWKPARFYAAAACGSTRAR
jgi:hypothetical protein